MHRVLSLVAATGLLWCVEACEPPNREEVLLGKERYRQLVAEQRARDSTLEATRKFLQDELPRREAQWTAQRLSAYRLAVRVICSCEPEPPLAVVTVRGDSITVTDAFGYPHKTSLSPWLASAVPRLAFSVPRMFAELRHGVADTTWTVEVTFDSIYGYPKEIIKQKRLDDPALRGRDYRALVDLGYRVVVESFEALAGRPSAPHPLRQN